MKQNYLVTLKLVFWVDSKQIVRPYLPSYNKWNQKNVSCIERSVSITAKNALLIPAAIVLSWEYLGSCHSQFSPPSQHNWHLNKTRCRYNQSEIIKTENNRIVDYSHLFCNSREGKSFKSSMAFEKSACFCPLNDFVLMILVVFNGFHVKSLEPPERPSPRLNMSAFKKILWEVSCVVSFYCMAARHAVLYYWVHSGLSKLMIIL